MLTRRDTEPWRKDEKLRDGMSIITLPPSRVFEPKASILITLLCLCLSEQRSFSARTACRSGAFFERTLAKVSQKLAQRERQPFVTYQAQSCSHTETGGNEWGKCAIIVQK